MEEFDVNAFLKMCGDTVASFKKIELDKYPQNEFILKTPTQINEEFREALNEIKLEVGLIADEVYITKWSDGISTASLGSTLLDKQVIFLETFDLTKFYDDESSEEVLFLDGFESKFRARHVACTRLFEITEEEISEAWNAKFVPSEEVASVLQALRKEHKAYYNLLCVLSKKNI